MNPSAQNHVSPHAPLALHALHQRTFEANRFVYPVLSRRSGGMSIGVNLNPDKVCNFDCIYCQVDRRQQSETQFVEMPALLAELDAMLGLVASGRIYETEKFRETPEPLRRLNDIAFSGDGEPTTYRNFDEIIAACAELKRQHGLGTVQDPVKMVLITNASMFHRPHVRRGLEILDANQGEIWAKLESGTEAYYKLVERTPIPFRRILDNITEAARVRPLVIQSLFMRIGGEPPSSVELEAFCDRLNEIVAAGGQIKLVQIYTIARRPAEDSVAPLTDAEVDAIVEIVLARTGLPTAGFYGAEGTRGEGRGARESPNGA
jgi:wyosine [tRNA(Phe)-imidazoG37] synthetase (radical SAM superfamily)